MTTRADIIRVCDSVKELLLEKNAKYGDSALEPIRTFSKASAVEQILVRIDDKLSRISRGSGLVGDDEDVIQDLIGYLVLLTIAFERQEKPSVADPLPMSVIVDREIHPREQFQIPAELLRDGELTARQRNAHGVVPNVYD